MTETLAIDRRRGALLGCVVGDAFGSVLEGASQRGVDTLVDRRVHGRVPWGYTDDATMAIALARAIIADSTVTPVGVLEHLAQAYDPVRGFGHGMKLAIAAFRRGVPWQRCAFQAWPEGSRGNGGAVRVAPVVCVRWPGRLEFKTAVDLSVRVTHAHRDAIEMAQLLAAAMIEILEDPRIADDFGALANRIRQRLEPVEDGIERALTAIAGFVERNATTREVAQGLGTSPLASESVPAALWSFAARHSTFAESVAAAARLGGDVDSICAMVGALAGSLHGSGSIPSHWIENLEREDTPPKAVVELAESLIAVEAEPPRAA